MPSKKTLPSPRIESLWNRFSHWWERLFVGEKPRYPRPIGEPIASTLCTLYQYERFEPHACYTWRAIPTYYVKPPGAHIFLLCDSLKGVPKTNPLATHRLTIALMSAGAKDKYWSEDFEMTSDWGEGNCAWIVTRLLAAMLLRVEYSALKPTDWSAKAAIYVKQNRQ